MSFSDTWHWILAVFLCAEIFFWLAKKISRFIRDRTNAWGEIQKAELQKAKDLEWQLEMHRMIKDECEAKGIKRPPVQPVTINYPADIEPMKDPVFRPGIWMQK